MQIFLSLEKKTSKGRQLLSSDLWRCRWGMPCCCKSSCMSRKHSLCTKQKRMSSCLCSMCNQSTEAGWMHIANLTMINWRGKFLAHFPSLLAERTHIEIQYWLGHWLQSQICKQLETNSGPVRAVLQYMCCSWLLLNGGNYISSYRVNRKISLALLGLFNIKFSFTN
jgi:hypothetical protein